MIFEGKCTVVLASQSQIEFVINKMHQKAKYLSQDNFEYSVFRCLT